MLALRSSPPVFTIAEAQAIARDTYGLAVSIRALSGERDCNFHLRTGDGREFVLKIQDAAADPQGTDCQIRVLRHLAETDPSLPVPRVFATREAQEVGGVRRDGIEYATCLLGYLRGPLLAERNPDEHLLRHIGATLARVDRALQGFFHPALARSLAWDVRRLPELAGLVGIESPVEREAVARAVDALQQRLPALRALRSQAIHGDCHARNLLVDEATLKVCGILDFGDMLHAPLALEPAVAMSELLTEGLAAPASLGWVLSGYVQDCPLEPAEVEVLFDLIAARHAATLLLHAWRGRHDQAGARILDACAAQAARSLASLLHCGREALTRDWHRAAGTVPAGAARCAASAVDLSRRRRLLGAGAELFYEQPLHFVRASGVWLYDVEGRPHLDVYNNVAHVGHTHPSVVEAIQRQTAVLSTHTRYLHANILEYAQRLTATLPAHLDTCIFVNSGSEANDVAWRIAKMSTGHEGALVMAHAYHGITDAVAALTPGMGPSRDSRVVTVAAPPEGLQVNAALGAQDLAAAVGDVDGAIRSLAGHGFEPAAFFIDSALTSTGIFDPPPTWLAALSDRVRAVGGLVVADEVQYGLGRCGSHFWGFERRGLSPDIVTLGKPVGNGYPMGVVIANRAIIEAFQAKFGFFSTFGGNPVAAAAGLAVLEVLEREQLMANALATGEYLRRRLEAIALRHACLGAVRGAGLLVGLEIRGADAHAAQRATRQIVNILASQARVLIGSEGPGGNVLKLRPPLPFGAQHVDLLSDALDAAAAAVDGRAP